MITIICGRRKGQREGKKEGKRKTEMAGSFLLVFFITGMGRAYFCRKKGKEWTGKETLLIVTIFVFIS